MKLIRRIALTALVTFTTFGAVTFTSCNPDECKDVVCANNGTCNSADGSCTCQTGYEGTTCQTLSRAKFVGVYVGNEQCTVGTDQYSITITENSDAIKLTMSNIYNQAFTAVGTMSGTNTFSFNNTQSGSTFSGTGTLNGNQLTVSYQISDGITTNACTFTGTK